MSSPLRVCLAAENVSRRLGGEALLPFHYFRLFLQRGVDVHLITHERSRAELVQLFPEHVDRLHFVPDHLLQKLFFRLGKLLPRRLAEATFGLATQLLTQSRERRVIRPLLTARCVIHQPIPVAPRFPSLLNGLGAPLIVGPLNGGMHFPPAFRSMESRTSRWLVHLGRQGTDLANRLLPGKREAAVVLVSNERTRAALPSGLRGRILELPENGVDLASWPASEQGHSGAPQDTAGHSSPARFLFLGRLVDWKALDIVLDAMALLPSLELDVAGDGPMRNAWETQARSLGLSSRVRFHGLQSQCACAELLQHATALVLPSLYESGGAVVLEAMAAGKPVIATAWGGPVEYLDSTCGILLAPASRAALVDAFAQSMQHLAASPELCRQLGAAGRAKVVDTYDWERKADTILAIYQSVLPPNQAAGSGTSRA